MALADTKGVIAELLDDLGLLRQLGQPTILVGRLAGDRIGGRP